MGKKIYQIGSFVLLAYLTTLSFLAGGNHLMFGVGVGDMFMCLTLIAFTIALYIGVVIFLALKQNRFWWVILFCSSLIFTLYISLEATFWRGPEFRWNGQIFF